MYRLLICLPLLVGCTAFAELAPEPKAPAFVVPEGSGAVEVSTHAACDCGLDRAEVAAEIQSVKNRVEALEVSVKPRGEKLTQPAQKPAPVQAKASESVCGPGGCSVGPARRAVGKGLFFRRR